MVRITLITLLLLISACQKEEPAPPAESASAADAPAAAESISIPRTPAPATAAVFFVTPAHQAAVSNPIRVEFGLTNMDVVPAGTEAPNSGHHHLLIDTDLPDFGLPIPADEHHIHFGDGSTSTELTLEPGKHTLQLLLADHLHIPHNPPVVSERITITVE